MELFEWLIFGKYLVVDKLFAIFNLKLFPTLRAHCRFINPLKFILRSGIECSKKSFPLKNPSVEVMLDCVLQENSVPGVDFYDGTVRPYVRVFCTV